MNVSGMDAPRALPRLVAVTVAVGLAVSAIALLVHAALDEARLEVVLAGLGLAAAAALVGLLAAGPGVVVRHRD